MSQRDAETFSVQAGRQHVLHCDDQLAQAHVSLPPRLDTSRTDTDWPRFARSRADRSSAKISAHLSSGILITPVVESNKKPSMTSTRPRSRFFCFSVIPVSSKTLAATATSSSIHSPQVLDMKSSTYVCVAGPAVLQAGRDPARGMWERAECPVLPSHRAVISALMMSVRNWLLAQAIGGLNEKPIGSTGMT
eukprot:3932946-Rhodomonas_salina.1